MRQLIEKFCMQNGLPTFGPYDIWKTYLGFCVKGLLNRNRPIGFLLAAILPRATFCVTESLKTQEFVTA